MSEPAKHDPYSVFQYRPFVLYISSYVLAVISSAMLSFGAKFEINELTRDSSQGAPYYLGLLGAVGAIPIIGLSLFAGHAVDRFNRKTVLLLTQLVLVICPLVFAVLAWRDIHNIWMVYGVVAANGTALTFARPARSALISVLVPREAFASAVTWNSTFFETSAAIGPALAGPLIAFTNLWTALIISGACMAGCFALSLFLPRPPEHAGPRQRMNLAGLFTGFRFVYRTRLLYATLALDLFAVLFGGATYLMPVFADELGVGASGLGWMIAAPGVGAIVMALVQAHRPPFKRAGRAMLLSVVGFGVVTIGFGLSSSFLLSLALLVLMGAFDNVSVIVRHSLVQLLTPDAMRGRVNAVNQVFIGSSNELGGLESGMSSRLLGSIRASVVLGGMAVLGVVGFISARYPEVRKLGRLGDVEVEPGEPNLATTDPRTVTTPLQSTT